MSTDNLKENLEKNSNDDCSVTDLFSGFCKQYGLKKWSCIDYLLYKLCPENGKQWNMKTLDNYLNIVYTKADILEGTELQTKEGWGDKSIVYHYVNKSVENYNVINTTLLDKNYEEIYFISFSEQPLNDIGFFTKKEIEALKNAETILSIVKKTKRVYFYEEKDLSYLLPKGISDIDFGNDEDYKEHRKDRIYKICELIGNNNDLKSLINNLLYSKEIPYSRNVSNELIKDDYKLQGISHLIIDGSDNFPLSLLNSFFNYQFQDYLDYKKRKYGIQLCIFYAGTTFEKGGKKYKIEEGDCFKILSDILKNATDETLKRFKNDNSLIAPIYYVKKDKISYILPLYISHNKKPDCVLLFNKDEDEKGYENKKSDRYIATTILNMEEAYTDARILGAVDKYQWLNQ